MNATEKELLSDLLPALKGMVDFYERVMPSFAEICGKRLDKSDPEYLKAKEVIRKYDTKG